MGDGEMQAGIVWEAATVAAKYHLNNLTVILDYNDVQLDGAVHEIMPLEPLADRWKAFNWHVVEINGHNIRQVIEALDLPRKFTANQRLSLPTRPKEKACVIWKMIIAGMELFQNRNNMIRR